MRVALLAAALLSGTAHADDPLPWLLSPTSDQIERAYPDRAERAGVSGSAEMQCDIASDGTLARCWAMNQAPSGWGFGAAATTLASDFRLSLPRQGVPTGVTIKVPIRFAMAGVPPPAPPAGGEAPLRAESTPSGDHPYWLKRPGVDDIARVYPIHAVRTRKSGYAEINCEVAPNGTLRQCTVLTESPLGEGFGAAALALAPEFRMHIPQGTPTDRAGTVKIPIRFSVN